MPRPHPNSAVASTPVQIPCRIWFGASAPAIRWADLEASLDVALPLLGGTECHELLAEGSPSVLDRCTISQQGGRMAGFALAPADIDLESAARELYRRVFAVTQGRSLYRIWNYVPKINAVADGLENYRRFCLGRSLAFESHLGSEFQRQLPAASAVGTSTGPLAIAFLAGDETVRHFENPKQVPAFEYPPAYGPRPPSFSRATLVTGESERQIFISGTAAIRGHVTMSALDLAGQLTCTHENLQFIAEAAGAGPGLGAKHWRRSFNAYMRRDTDLLHVKTYLERHVLRPSDEISYLQADLCRADLRVEIEAVLTGPV